MQVNGCPTSLAKQGHVKAPLKKMILLFSPPLAVVCFLLVAAAASFSSVSGDATEHRLDCLLNGEFVYCVCLLTTFPNTLLSPFHQRRQPTRRSATSEAASGFPSPIHWHREFPPASWTPPRWATPPSRRASTRRQAPQATWRHCFR